MIFALLHSLQKTLHARRRFCFLCIARRSFGLTASLAEALRSLYQTSASLHSLQKTLRGLQQLCMACSKLCVCCIICRRSLWLAEGFASHAAKQNLLQTLQRLLQTIQQSRFNSAKQRASASYAARQRASVSFAVRHCRFCIACLASATFALPLRRLCICLCGVYLPLRSLHSKQSLLQVVQSRLQAANHAAR